MFQQSYCSIAKDTLFTLSRSLQTELEWGLVNMNGKAGIKNNPYNAFTKFRKHVGHSICNEGAFPLHTLQGLTIRHTNQLADS